MAVASNINFLWTGSVASIPAGFSANSTLYDKYFRVATAGGDGGGTGGAASHNHTSPSHTPTQTAHSHYIYDGGDDGSNYTAGVGTPSLAMAPLGHTHPSVDGDSGMAFSATSTTATNTGITITVNNSTNNDPPYYTVIFIKSDGTPAGLPNNALAFFASDTLPAGTARFADTKDKYLKGASSGAAGAGTGGSASHSHTSPAHTHGQNSHTHAGVTCPTVDVATNRKSSAGTTYARSTHRHSVSGDSQTPTNNSVTTTINSATTEPTYKKLNIIQNTSGSSLLVDDLIGLWFGNNADIPTDWTEVSGYESKFVKGANADGESGSTTGGDSQHNHTASNCQPTQNAHSHNWSDAGGTVTTNATGSGVSISAGSHTHSWVEDTPQTTATNNSVAVTVDNSASEDQFPQYVRGILIKYTTPVVGGAYYHVMIMEG